MMDAVIPSIRTRARALVLPSVGRSQCGGVGHVNDGSLTRKIAITTAAMRNAIASPYNMRWATGEEYNPLLIHADCASLLVLC